MTGKNPELEAILERWVHAHLVGNGQVVRNLVSRDLGTLYCGTAADEVITGQRLQDGIVAHIDEISDADLEIEELTLHSNSWEDAGWALAQSRVRIANSETTVLWRISAFFRLEDGQWVANHAHCSFATDFHETLMGLEHNAFQDLLNAANEMDLQIGGASSATVMFTDIVGSTALVEAIGDRRWTALVNSHVADLTTAVEAEDGRMIKSLGDGTMSTFPSAGGAMRAAQAIQRLQSSQTEEPNLRVRIGLHTGDVIEAADDFFGTVVNKAARVAAAADPQEILVSDATRVMVGGARDFVFSTSAQLKLKGLDGSHAVHKLDWQA